MTVSENLPSIAVKVDAWFCSPANFEVHWAGGVFPAHVMRGYHPGRRPDNHDHAGAARHLTIGNLKLL
ncbi:hypothetical protein D3C81_1845030 [compost metagenome]